jgi:hypothetical protein
MYLISNNLKSNISLEIQINVLFSRFKLGTLLVKITIGIIIFLNGFI